MLCSMSSLLKPLRCCESKEVVGTAARIYNARRQDRDGATSRQLSGSVDENVKASQEYRTKDPSSFPYVLFRGRSLRVVVNWLV
jgi:hypothetical protein